MNLLSPIAWADTQSGVLDNPPRVIRYISSLPVHHDEICYGLILADDDGIPTRVRALSDYHASLCHPPDDARHPQLHRLLLAFEAADTAALRARSGDYADELTEEFAPERLAQQILAPVAISSAELDGLERVVIGAGLNYADHRDEVGLDEAAELLLFPKPVVPTGAYTPVRTGMQIGEEPARPVLLLDYEVELGLVLLEAIDLHDPPVDYAAFIEKVAFFIANDVSDREPIILDDQTGYTRGKSHPTYLPTGPWMIHGRHLQPRAPGEGVHNLEIGLSVSGGPYENPDLRQLAHTKNMLRGPWAIIRHMSERFRNNEIVCMRDADGHPRFLHTAAGIIPAGSILLTGTPGGTAIREPGLWQKAEIFLRGGLSLAGARRVFIEDAEREHIDSDYLHAGDRVDSWVEYLGRQRWQVAVDSEQEPYGISDRGACMPGSRPQPVLHR